MEESCWRGAGRSLLIRSLAEMIVPDASLIGHKMVEKSPKIDACATRGDLIRMNAHVRPLLRAETRTTLISSLALQEEPCSYYGAVLFSFILHKLLETPARLLIDRLIADADFETIAFGGKTIELSGNTTSMTLFSHQQCQQGRASAMVA